MQLMDGKETKKEKERPESTHKKERERERKCMFYYSDEK